MKRAYGNGITNPNADVTEVPDNKMKRAYRRVTKVYHSHITKPYHSEMVTRAPGAYIGRTQAYNNPLKVTKAYNNDFTQAYDADVTQADDTAITQGYDVTTQSNGNEDIGDGVKESVEEEAPQPDDHWDSCKEGWYTFENSCYMFRLVICLPFFSGLVSNTGMSSWNHTLAPCIPIFSLDLLFLV